ncbi:MAG: alpha/beta hydrolase [Bacteroidetes bacterium]|nr:alpha/beta hydrolase [Bacteroidota bacterium]
MKIKKRYAIAAVLCSGLFITCQMEFMKFRKNDETQRAFLLERGQAAVIFDSIEAEGRTLHLTRSGVDGLPLVLLVHGSPGSSDAMLDYLADTNLTRQALVIAVDRPGFGYSGFGETERSLKQQARMLKPLLEKFRTGKAVLVGHSYGGPLIARMAMDFPELVDGLVIVAGSIDPALEPKYWLARPFDWWGLRWMVPPAFRVSNQEILPLKKELEGMLPLWGKITCPVTVVQGTKDDLVPAGNAGFAKKMLTNSRLVGIEMLEGGGHFIMWTEEKLIAQKILDLLAHKAETVK